MKDFKYDGSVFQIKQDGDCSLLVTDGTNSVSVEVNRKLGRQPFVYRLPNGLGWQATTEKNAVEGACQKLIQLRAPRPTHEELCKSLSDFYDNLD